MFTFSKASRQTFSDFKDVLINIWDKFKLLKTETSKKILLKTSIDKSLSLYGFFLILTALSSS